MDAEAYVEIVLLKRRLGASINSKFLSSYTNYRKTHPTCNQQTKIKAAF